MIFFTSDLHLGHENILRFMDRPFSSVEEMDEVLIDNYDSMVTDKDTVYILGDLSFRADMALMNKKFARLRGKKHLIIGNHDKYSRYNTNLFREMCDYKLIIHERQRIAMMHYPLLEWNFQRYGSLMLHGHIHSDGAYNEENRKNGILRYDVGVDANRYYPVSLEQIKDFFGIGV